jgi:hypothetical protein
MGTWINSVTWSLALSTRLTSTTLSIEIDSYSLQQLARMTLMSKVNLRRKAVPVIKFRLESRPFRQCQLVIGTWAEAEKRLARAHQGTPSKTSWKTRCTIMSSPNFTMTKIIYPIRPGEMGSKSRGTRMAHGVEITVVAKVCSPDKARKNQSHKLNCNDLLWFSYKSRLSQSSKPLLRFLKLKFQGKQNPKFVLWMSKE